ncbi:hypothetical protein ACFCW2_03655 [Qipengyuania sp. DSG2-2]|uniref:hypothetical protein n=1 Tax=Qipengyuania sp. DGS2-2 TaxID=3349631 RepID=UPI0036D3B3CD
MNLALALFLTASASGVSGAAPDGASSGAARDAMIAATRAEGRASVTILQPEVIDFDAMKERGERAKLRRDAAGTVWLEFS